MYLSEKSFTEKAGRAGIVLGLHALFAIGLVSLGAGGVVEKIREGSITVYPPEKTKKPEPIKKSILPETNLKKIDVYVPTPEYAVDIKQIDPKQPIFQQSDKPEDEVPTRSLPEKRVDPIQVPRDPVITIASLDKQYMASFQPTYPPSARRADIEGTVSVRVRIGTDGKVITATVEKSSSFEVLDTAAIQHALKKWRFKPATQDGKPIEGVRVISVVFQLKHEG